MKLNKLSSAFFLVFRNGLTNLLRLDSSNNIRPGQTYMVCVQGRTLMNKAEVGISQTSKITCIDLTTSTVFIFIAENINSCWFKLHIIR